MSWRVFFLQRKTYIKRRWFVQDFQRKEPIKLLLHRTFAFYFIWLFTAAYRIFKSTSIIKLNAILSARSIYLKQASYSTDHFQFTNTNSPLDYWILNEFQRNDTFVIHECEVVKWPLENPRNDVVVASFCRSKNIASLKIKNFLLPIFAF